MSEKKGRPEYARYEAQSTEELQEILRKHAHNEIQIEMDTEELFYIMEVLSERNNQTPEQIAKTTQDAYAAFREHYMPKENSTAGKTTAKVFSARWMKVAVAAVVALVILCVTTASAQAFGVDIWGRFASWTKEIFQFQDASQHDQGKDPEKENNLELKSLQDALDQYNITQKLIPTYLPSGYTFADINVFDSPREVSVSAKFNRENDELIISIRQTIGKVPEQIEKSDKLLEVYTIGGVDYYIFSNTETLQAAWVVGEFECQIIGKISVEEMKEMINSI